MYVPAFAFFRSFLILYYIFLALLSFAIGLIQELAVMVPLCHAFKAPIEGSCWSLFTIPYLPDLKDVDMYWNVGIHA